MIWEATINYTTINEVGDEKKVKEQYVCDGRESFSDVEQMLWSMFGSYDNFSVATIKQSKIKEIANGRTSDDESIWQAEMKDVFHDDEGNEKETKYKIVFFSKTYESANTFIIEYAKQGYNLSLISLKQTKIEDVI